MDTKGLSKGGQSDSPKQKNTRKKASAAKRKIVIRRQFSPEPIPFKGEVNNLPSLTVPNMSLTVAQLYRNHTKGIPSDVQERTPIYTETEIPRFDDINELVEWRNEILRKADEVAEDIKNRIEEDLKKRAENNQIDLEDSIREVEEEQVTKDKP